MKISFTKGLFDRQSLVAQYLAIAIFTIGIASSIGTDDLLAAFAAGCAVSWKGHFNDLDKRTKTLNDRTGTLSERTETLCKRTDILHEHAENWEERSEILDEHIKNIDEHSKNIDEHNINNAEKFPAVIDLVLNCVCFIYIGAWLPFDMFNWAVMGIVPWKLVMLSLAILALRRIPCLLLLYKFVPDVENWKEALLCGHFGECYLQFLLMSSDLLTYRPYGCQCDFHFHPCSDSPAGTQ